MYRCSLLPLILFILRFASKLIFLFHYLSYSHKPYIHDFNTHKKRKENGKTNPLNSTEEQWWCFSVSKESPHIWDNGNQVKVTVSPSDYWTGSSANTHLSFSTQQAVIHPLGGRNDLYCTEFKAKSLLIAPVKQFHFYQLVVVLQILWIQWV